MNSLKKKKLESNQPLCMQEIVLWDLHKIILSVLLKYVNKPHICKPNYIIK